MEPIKVKVSICPSCSKVVRAAVLQEMTPESIDVFAQEAFANDLQVKTITLEEYHNSGMKFHQRENCPNKSAFRFKPSLKIAVIAKDQKEFENFVNQQCFPNKHHHYFLISVPEENRGKNADLILLANPEMKDTFNESRFIFR